MSITKLSDYTDRFAIAQNRLTESKLQASIDFYEPVYLKKLLGKDLYDLLIADLDPVTGLPTTQRFIDIWEPIYIEDNHCFCSHNLTSEGIPEMLKGFVFFEYTRKQNQKNTIVGNVKGDAENSTNIDNQNSYMIEIFNWSVMYYKTIRHILITEPDIYPEYKGRDMDFSTIIY